MELIADGIERKKAEGASADLVRMFHQMAARIGRGNALAAIEHAVGTYCDQAGPRYSLFMGASIAKIDPERIAAMVDRTRMRTLLQ